MTRTTNFDTCFSSTSKLGRAIKLAIPRMEEVGDWVVSIFHFEVVIDLQHHHTNTTLPCLNPWLIYDGISRRLQYDGRLSRCQRAQGRRSEYRAVHNVQLQRHTGQLQ